MIHEPAKTALTPARAPGRNAGRPTVTSEEAPVVLAKKLHADKSLEIDDICNGDSLFVHRRKRPADGRYVRQTVHSENPPNHRIVVIVVAISQPAKTEDEMDDQPENDVVGTIGRTLPEMRKASLKLPLNPESGK